jgi:6-phosphogluconolactonase
MPEPQVVVLVEFDREAAALIVGQLRDSIREHGRASLVLAGGGTPLGVYRQLAAGQSLPWERVHLFWGDERLVPPGHPGSNYGAAREALLSRIPIPAENIHRIKGELPAEAAVADYTEQLRAWAAAHDPDAPHPWPRFDMVLLGLGEDGHTASLFPGSPVEADAPVIAVTADYQGRPAGRVTLTPLTLNDAHQIVFIVSGSNKANAVYNTFNTDDPVRYPAQRIRPDAGEVVWLMDRAAAAHLG